MICINPQNHSSILTPILDLSSGRSYISNVQQFSKKGTVMKNYSENYPLPGSVVPIPVLNISTNATGWSRSVTVTLDAPEEIDIYVSTDQQSWEIAAREFEITQNGTFYFRMVDPLSKEILDEKSLDITNIDDQLPVISDIRTVTASPFRAMVCADFSDNVKLASAEYRIGEEGKWMKYDSRILLMGNDTIFFRATDIAGNEQISQYTVGSLDSIADPEDTEYVLIKSSLSAKNNGKLQNGVTVDFGVNAFKTISDATDLAGKAVVLLDAKNKLTAEDLEKLAGVETLYGNTLFPTEKPGSYKLNLSSKNQIDINNAATAIDLARFATVNLNSAETGNISGGSAAMTDTVKLGGAGNLIETLSSSHSRTVSGKVTMKNYSSAGNIENYSSVTLVDESSAGNIVNEAFKYSYTQKSTSGVISDITRTETYSASGTVTMDDSYAKSISGFKTVKLEDSRVGNIELGDSYTEKYTLKKNKTTTTVTFSRTGTLTADDSRVEGNISGFATVKLTDGTRVDGNIELGMIEKIVNGEKTFKAAGSFTAADSYAGNITGYAKVTLNGSTAGDIVSTVNSKGKLSGSVTMTASTAGNVENYSSLTLSDAAASAVSNINKVTAKAGFSVIESYTGTAGNDTLTINKNAVLTLGDIDFSAGGKDKFVNNGTLILTADINRSFISGKGEIAAANDVYETLNNKSGVLNLGATAEGFRTKKYENSDDTYKKAVNWNLKSDHTGWLGDWEECSVSDTADFIKFKVGKEGASISVLGDVEYTLWDNKGKEIDADLSELAAGNYILKLELGAGSDSVSYTLAMTEIGD